MLDNNDPALKPLDNDEDDNRDDEIVTYKKACKAWKTVAEYIFKK